MSIEEYSEYLNDLSIDDLFREFIIIERINKLNRYNLNIKYIKDKINNIIWIKQELPV